MTCMDAGIDVGRIERIGAAHVAKRKQLLRELGIADEGHINRLAHSGRNGLIHYLKNNYVVSPTVTTSFQSASAHSISSAITEPSGAIVYSTPITPA